MIHKAYHPDGKPDWANWVMECDSCRYRALLCDGEEPQWLITPEPGMAIYCPDCFNAWADTLIASALRCPDCDHTRLRMQHTRYSDQVGEGYTYSFIHCGRCGAVLLMVTDEPPF